MVWRTTLITMSTSFFLGTTFCHWIADHNVLWKNPVTADAITDSIKYYSLLAGAPVGMGWAYTFVGLVLLLSVGGRSVKGYSRPGGEVLFDGGSIVLIAALMWTQYQEIYSSGIAMIPSPLPAKLLDHPLYPTLNTVVRDLATNNIMTSVMLTGLVLLQAGRYYAKRPSSAPPAVVGGDSTSSTPSASSPVTRPVAVSKRSGTPFRELTEEESFELNASSGDER
ncbi:hypothetical protein IAT38_005648 [Cryptococcus sp. DSM 104549]